MDAEQHPALIAAHDELPSLTLVLPAGLGKDQALPGLVQAIGQVRTDLAARARLFQQRAGECAASGDLPGQALCRGQVLASEHAASAIDEGIVGAFGLWEQYEREIHPAGHIAGDGAAQHEPSRPGSESGGRAATP
jgi:hypothetical protein